MKKTHRHRVIYTNVYIQKINNISLREYLGTLNSNIHREEHNHVKLAVTKMKDNHAAI